MMYRQPKPLPATEEKKSGITTTRMWNLVWDSCWFFSSCTSQPVRPLEVDRMFKDTLWVSSVLRTGTKIHHRHLHLSKPSSLPSFKFNSRALIHLSDLGVFTTFSLSAAAPCRNHSPFQILLLCCTFSSPKTTLLYHPASPWMFLSSQTSVVSSPNLPSLQVPSC